MLRGTHSAQPRGSLQLQATWASGTECKKGRGRWCLQTWAQPAPVGLGGQSQQQQVVHRAHSRQHKGLRLGQGPGRRRAGRPATGVYTWGHGWPPHNLWKLCYLPKLSGGHLFVLRVGMGPRGKTTLLSLPSLLDHVASWALLCMWRDGNYRTFEGPSARV